MSININHYAAKASGAAYRLARQFGSYKSISVRTHENFLYVDFKLGGEAFAKTRATDIAEEIVAEIPNEDSEITFDVTANRVRLFLVVK